MPPTQQQPQQILPNAGPVAGVFVSALNDAMARFKIEGLLRVAAFLALRNALPTRYVWNDKRRRHIVKTSLQ